MTRKQCTGIVFVVLGVAFIMHETEHAWQLLGLFQVTLGWILMMLGADS